MGHAHRYAEALKHHCAVAADVDQRRRDLREFVEYVPGAQTEDDVRAACARARAAGLKWVPPCERTDRDGRCRGHAADPRADTWGT